MAEEQNTAAEDNLKPSKKKLIIIIVAAVLVLGLVAGGVGYWLLSGDAESSEESSEEVAEQEVLGDLEYHSMNPPFVMSYLTRTGQRYLQIGVMIATRSPKVVETVELHDPMIRSEMLRIIGEQDFNRLRTDEGKKHLQHELEERLRAILRAEAQLEGLDAVLFNNFVMQ